ncbi:hypothetical protein ETAA8_16890 [Anatilimnocola aggregata]|uniref:Uncharacterized protein n=2 Tax=Anatilimnocola aggregata TaxID=2528021 RepID=A0A517Y8N4_9BACT|nr:hypothetical protein ETAA8_16890 [Anatilimnocola aggregata]
MEVIIGADDTIFRCGDELIVRLPQLGQWRYKYPKLNATLKLTGASGEKVLQVNLSDRLTPEAMVIDVVGFGACSAVSLEVKDATGKSVHAQQVSPVPTVTILNTLPLQNNTFAAIEPGSKLDPSATPRIALPDLTKLRMQDLTGATRTVTTDSITYPVITDADLPGIASNNGTILSRQSFAPDDPTKVSLYFSYRKAIYDTSTTKLKEWRKMLIEVPLDRAWLNKQGDETITLPLDGFAIHTTEERELANPRWNDPLGYNMLGGSSSGLYQGGQSVEVDDQGRIYISNVADGAGIVRFNPHTGKFEQPPVCFQAETRKFVPETPGIKRNWDLDDAKLVCTRGRLYIVFDRNYRVSTPNGEFETCSGVVSVPLENWHDAEVFRKDIRLHAACWPTAKVPLYNDELIVGSSRKAGAPVATKRGITFGTYRLDLDANGNTERLSVIKTIRDPSDAAGRSLPPTEFETIKGLQRQRYINIGAAGRQFVRLAYGECSISRAAIALSMPDAPADLIADSTGRHRTTFSGAPSGELTIRFDITAKIKRDPQRFATLAAAMIGISQGPNYAVIDAPGEADRVIGVCDYNYFYSKLDFSRRVAERKVYKSYLPLMSNGQVTGQPASVGLGPYNSTWVEHDNALWLYITGYTGISRIKYAEGGKTLAGFTAEHIHGRLLPQPIDVVTRDNVKDFLYVLPATDNRLINIGRGRVGRGGGARSAGLELFDPSTLGKSQSAVEMNRCYGLFTPLSRLIYSPSGSPVRQEIYAASGNIRREYVEDITDPAQRPKNQDPKIFAYDCASGAGLRDLYGFSLPLNPNGDNSANLVFSPCHQFLVVMQGGGTLLTYSLAQRRFVDGLQLRNSAGEPIHLLDYSKPSAWIWTAPDGQIFFHAALDGDASKSVNFFNVQVTNAGQITVAPQLAVTWDKVGQVKDFNRIVRCFLPDLNKHDGSYDLVLGGDSDNGGQPTVRVIDDFVPAQ